jgi:hypothetical protein
MARTACKGGDLEEALEEDKRLLILRGALDSKADLVYQEAKGIFEPRLERALLICDASILKDAEESKWFGDEDDRYVVLKQTDRTIVSSGDIAKLLKADGTPSPRKIARAMAGDL